MRQALVVGNWKMHGSRTSVAALAAGRIGESLALPLQKLPFVPVMCTCRRP